MIVIKKIDDLIEAGWHVLESDFDPGAFKKWKKEAFECVTALVGPDHPYAQYFSQFVLEPKRRNLLAGEGILVAMRHTVPPGPRTQPTLTRRAGSRDVVERIEDRLGNTGHGFERPPSEGVFGQHH